MGALTTGSKSDGVVDITVHIRDIELTGVSLHPSKRTICHIETAGREANEEDAGHGRVFTGCTELFCLAIDAAPRGIVFFRHRAEGNSRHHARSYRRGAGQK